PAEQSRRSLILGESEVRISAMPTSSEIDVRRLRAISNSMALRSVDAEVMCFTFQSWTGAKIQTHRSDKTGRGGYRSWCRTERGLPDLVTLCRREDRLGHKSESPSIPHRYRPADALWELRKNHHHLRFLAGVEWAGRWWRQCGRPRFPFRHPGPGIRSVLRVLHRMLRVVRPSRKDTEL